MPRSECVNCGKVFNTTNGFDKHRTGGYGEFTYAPGDRWRANPIGRTPSTRRCMTTEEMLAIGMVLKPTGRWATSDFDMTTIKRDEDEGEAAD